MQLSPGWQLFVPAWILAYGGAFLLIMLVWAQVYMSVRLNKWRGDFWDLMQNVHGRGRTVDEFWKSIASSNINIYEPKSFSNVFFPESFAQIVLVLVILGVISFVITRFYAFYWREAITNNYIPRWSNIVQKIEGAAQRLQEDPYKLASILESLGLKLIDGILTVIAFLPILWTLSAGILVPLISDNNGSFIWFMLCAVPSWVVMTKIIKETLTASKRTRFAHIAYIKVCRIFFVFFLITFFAVVFLYPLWLLSDWIALKIPIVDGSLTWLAILTSIGGMVVSWYVGIKLPGLEYNNQVQEAALRKEFVVCEDDIPRRIALHAAGKFTELFLGVKLNYFRLFWNYTYFDLWSSIYGQATYILPFLIIGPHLFTGAVTLGVLMRVADSFSQVHSSFSLIIYNWPKVNEVRSIWKRLHEFEANLDKHAVAASN